MKTLSSSTQTRIARQGGEDPYTLLMVEGLGETLYFGDRDTVISGLTVQGRIMEHSSTTVSTKIDSTVRTLGVVGTWNVTLSDNDEVLRTLLQSKRLQGVVARVYQVFEGQDLTDATLLLKGTIESAPEWREEDRTLSFMVETPRRLESVPFAPKESDELDVDEEALGQPWPLVYGDAVKDSPAVAIKSAPTGTLVQDIDEQVMSFDVEDADEEFPQGEAITILVGDEYMTGSFSGETFTVTARQVDKATNLEVSGSFGEVILPPGERAAGFYIHVVQGTFGTVPTPPTVMSGYCYRQEGTACSIWDGNTGTPIPAGSRARINRYPNLIADGARWETKGGTQVTLVRDNQIIYVANSIPSTEVFRVRAYRQVTNSDTGYSRRELVPVDPAFYTVNLNSGSYNGATLIRMDEPLSARGSGWEDTIYVSLKSTVGSNPADIIEDVITRFTDLDVDAASFAEVKAVLGFDPMNFGTVDQRDALALAADIAWQCRSAIVWSGETVKLIYLASRPTTVAADLTDETIRDGSITESSTPSENLITVMRGLWKRHPAEEEFRKYVVESNVDLYGRREVEYEVWAFQKRELVKRCIDFWSARRSNIWRTFQLKNWGYEGLGVDPYDHVQWSATGFYSSVPCLVFESTVDDLHTALWCQTPIKVGETTESDDFFTDTPTTGPDTPNIGSGGTEIEVIESPPPEVLVAPERDIRVFDVVATEDEVSNPNLSGPGTGYKTVEVRLIGTTELEASQQLAANLARIGEIDTTLEGLPAGPLATALQEEKATLVNDNLALQSIIDGEEGQSETVRATNREVSFMLAGDRGSMIKVAGGGYIVTPYNASGPFKGTVEVLPTSPAKGKLFSNVAGTLQGGPTEQVDITILGDFSGIELGDELIVHRDSSGVYYAQAPGGGGGVAFRGIVTGKVANAVYTADIYGTDGTVLIEDQNVSFLNVGNTEVIPNGYWFIGTKEGSNYYGTVPVWVA